MVIWTERKVYVHEICLYCTDNSEDLPLTIGIILIDGLTKIEQEEMESVV